MVEGLRTLRRVPHSERDGCGGGSGRNDFQFRRQDSASLQDTLTELFDDLKSFEGNIDTPDVKDQMAYFRTATSLLDKIMGMIERSHNVKAVWTSSRK